MKRLGLMAGLLAAGVVMTSFMSHRRADVEERVDENTSMTDAEAVNFARVYGVAKLEARGDAWGRAIVSQLAKIPAGR